MTPGIKTVIYPVEDRGLTGPVACWRVADIHESFKVLLGVGDVEQSTI